MTTWLARGWRSQKDSAHYSNKFKHLIKSNHSPTDGESKDIQAFVQALNLQVEALKNEKRPRRGVNLDRRIVKLTQDIQCYSSILSIIRIIPMELMQHIFLFCLLTGISPWTLSSICRSWRQYTFSTPLLWTELPKVSIGAKDRTKLAATLNRCKDMLHYSLNSPLIVRITTDDLKNSESEKIATDPAVTLLASHSPRWQSAEIALPSVAMVKLSTLLKGRLQGLKSLRLTFIWTAGAEVDEVDAFSGTPQLESLQILGAFSGRFHTTAPTLLSLVCAWPLPFNPSVLPQFTQLERLTITFSTAQRSSPFENILVFPNLRELIANLSSDHDFSFIQNIAVPVITDILLEPPKGSGPAPVSAMLMRSGQHLNPSIRRFQMRYSVVPEPGQTAALLKLMPELRTLGISMPHIDDINDFARIDNPVHLLVPKLEACTFFFEREHTSSRPSDYGWPFAQK